LSGKETKWIPIKEIIVTYLALSKVIYWVDTVGGIEQGGLGAIAEAVLRRLVQRDVLLIVSIIMFFVLEKLLMDKLKSSNLMKNVMLYVLGFIGMVGLFYVYLWVMSWFFEVTFPAPWVIVSNMIIGYCVAMVFLNIKYYFKDKEKENLAQAVADECANDKLAMLKILLDDGILTQEEYNVKKEKLK